MSYGFKLRSPDGGIIISEAAANLVFIGKATYSSDWHSGGLHDLNANRRNYWQLTYFITSPSRVTAYVQTVPGTYTGVESVSLVSGSTWRVIIGVQGYQNYRDFTPVVYCFSKAPFTSPSGWGLRVLAADGSVQFDSGNGYRYLQTTNIFIGSPPTSQNNQIPTNSESSVISGTVPTNVASSYSVNAKGKTNMFYNLALSSYSGNTCYIGWFALVGTSNSSWYILDNTPRVVSFINTDLYQ